LRYISIKSVKSRFWGDFGIAASKSNSGFFVWERVCESERVWRERV
jgi:hypothetical protein